MTPRSKTASEGYRIRSLVKGLQVLECVMERRDACRLTDLAEALHLDKSTALRYCATLEHLGYLSQDPLTKTYRLGPHAFDVGYKMLGRTDLRAVVGSWLQLLATRFKSSASMAVLRDINIVYVDRAVAENALAYTIPIGAGLPAHRTSIGRALLAQLSEDALDAALSRIREEDAGFTKTRVKEFRGQLKRIRKEGYALNIEGLRRGLSSIATPVREPGTNAVVGGINVAGYSIDMIRTRLENEIASVLLDASLRISRNEFAPGDLSGQAAPSCEDKAKGWGDRLARTPSPAPG